MTKDKIIKLIWDDWLIYENVENTICIINQIQCQEEYW